MAPTIVELYPKLSSHIPKVCLAKEINFFHILFQRQPARSFSFSCFHTGHCTRRKDTPARKVKHRRQFLNIQHERPSSSWPEKVIARAIQPEQTPAPDIPFPLA